MKTEYKSIDASKSRCGSMPPLTPETMNAQPLGCGQVPLWMEELHKSATISQDFIRQVKIRLSLVLRCENDIEEKGEQLAGVPDDLVDLAHGLRQIDLKIKDVNGFCEDILRLLEL